MNLDELVPAPNAEKVNKLAKRVFGYSLDLDKLTETKAKRLHKNLSTQMSLYESQLGSQAQKRTKYYEMKLALEALTKHIAERTVDEDDVEENNAFNSAAANAKKAGKSDFMFSGKKYKVKMDDKTADALTDDVQPVQEDNTANMPFMEVIYQYVDEEESSGDARLYLDGGRLVDDVQFMLEKDNPDVEIIALTEEVTQVNEGQVEASELVMAAKSMVDKYDQMIKDLSEMANEDLAPVADKVRDEMGSDVADNFTAQMTQALESTLAVMKTDRATAENATRVLVGDQPADTMGDDPIMTDEPDMEPTVDQDADDDFAAADAAMGGEEADLGREKRD